MLGSSKQVAAPPTLPIGPEAFAPSDRTTLWWLTQAGFLINARGTTIAIDPAIAIEPGSSDVSEAGFRLLVPLPLRASEVPRLDLVLITHTDVDHLGPLTVRALGRTEATFVGPRPVVAKLRELGVPVGRTGLVKPGDRVERGGVEILVTPADHAYQVQDPERYGPPFGPEDCCGFLLHTPDGTIWCTGDTRLLDAHLAVRDVDVFLLDVSRDPFHLGVENAARLANSTGAPVVIPHHYGTYDSPDFDAVNGDPAEVVPLIEDAAHRAHILAPGEPFVLGRWGR
jgi:L-ascorbate metabolism protein UlaG (beta-lactamase superfamily)